MDFKEAARYFAANALEWAIDLSTRSVLVNRGDCVTVFLYEDESFIVIHDDNDLTIPNGIALAIKIENLTEEEKDASSYQRAIKSFWQDFSRLTTKS